jgi:hypothetical protein
VRQHTSDCRLASPALARNRNLHGLKHTV